MSVLVVGLSHNSAPVPVLELIARDSDGTLKLIRARLPVEEPRALAA